MWFCSNQAPVSRQETSQLTYKTWCTEFPELDRHRQAWPGLQNFSKSSHHPLSFLCVERHFTKALAPLGTDIESKGQRVVTQLGRY